MIANLFPWLVYGALALAAAFAIAKLAGWIAWPWWWILLPFGAALAVLVLGVFGMILWAAAGRPW